MMTCIVLLSFAVAVESAALAVLWHRRTGSAGKMERLFRDLRTHWDHAREVHPYGALYLVPRWDLTDGKPDRWLADAREGVARYRNLETGTDDYYSVVLNCEIAEMVAEISDARWGRAYEECMDAAAVLLRMAWRMAERDRMNLGAEGIPTKETEAENDGR